MKHTAFRFLLLLFFCYAGTTAPLFSQDNDAPELVSQAAVLLDADTGTVIYSKNPNEEISPASLTKLMTIHLVMNEVNAGRASLDEIIPVTEESRWESQPPRGTRMWLAPGQIVTLREILLGLAIPSGNDAAVAAALRVAPSVPEFANMMTAEARRLGLAKTTFVEPSGISEDNMTTAAEFATFCREYVRLHPETLTEFHSVNEFAYPKTHNIPGAGRPYTVYQYNRNNLLKTVPGVDGLKTGYIDEAGYNIALTAERDGTRFIAVILGAPARPGGDRIRDRDGERLLTWAFENYKTVRPPMYKPEPARLWKGKAKWMELKVAEQDDLKNPLAFTAPINRANDPTNLQFREEIFNPLIAPLPALYPVGWLVISDNEGELHRVQLVTAQTYQKGNIFKRIWHSIRLFFMKKK